MLAPPVKLAALELGLPVLQPESTGTAAFRAEVAALEPEAFAVVAYGHLLGPKLLALAPRGAYNLHFSLLPRWRGAAPVQRSLDAGDAVTGVSIIRIVQELDAGPVLARSEVAIEQGEHAPSLEARLAVIGARLLVEALDRVERGEAREEAQDAGGVTLAPSLSKDEGLLDPRRPAEALARRVRAFDPWPGARLLLPKGAVQVLEAEACASTTEEAGLPVGSVLAPRGESLPVTCGEGLLLVHRVKPEGRAAMTARSLVNGRVVSPGDRAAIPDAALS